MIPEEEEKKTCPLMGKTCIGEECAWWQGVCSIQAIGFSLYELAHPEECDDEPETTDDTIMSLRRSALRGAPRVLNEVSASTGFHLDDDWDDEQELEARKRHRHIQWIKSLEPGDIPDALVGEVVGIKEGIIRLEEMLTLHFDESEEPDEVTELLYRERGQQWRDYQEERLAIVKMYDALNVAIGEFMAKAGKTDEDVIQELRVGACKQCESRDECLGKGVA